MASLTWSFYFFRIWNCSLYNVTRLSVDSCYKILTLNNIHFHLYNINIYSKLIQIHWLISWTENQVKWNLCKFISTRLSTHVKNCPNIAMADNKLVSCCCRHFPSEHFGKLVGIVIGCSGITLILQFPLKLLLHQGSSDNTFYVRNYLHSSA
jgi:hypothetical protein